METNRLTPVITASSPTPTSTGVEGGIDVDIRIDYSDGRVVYGSVTLLRDHTQCWTSWGDEPGHWAEQELLDAMDADDDYVEMAGEIVAHAAEAIESMDMAIDESYSSGFLVVLDDQGKQLYREDSREWASGWNGDRLERCKAARVAVEIHEKTDDGREAVGTRWVSPIE